MTESSYKKVTGKELLNACYFGNEELAIRYIKAGAPPTYTDPRDGWSSIHYAARWGKVRILNALLKAGVDINLRTMGRETALHNACRTGRKEVCVWLMKRGADPTIISSDGNRPSDLTVEEDIKFVCDHFDDFSKKTETENKNKQLEKQDKHKQQKKPQDT
jgi:ankyrin repeat protein